MQALGTAASAAAAPPQASARPPGIFVWEPIPTGVWEPLYTGIPATTTSLSTERQPSLMAELICVFDREIAMCSQLLKRVGPRTRFYGWRVAQAGNAIRIIDFAHAHSGVTNG